LVQKVHFSAKEAPQYSQKALSTGLSAPQEEHDFMTGSATAVTRVFAAGSDAEEGSCLATGSMGATGAGA
jgi:hypothetical protein